MAAQDGGLDADPEETGGVPPAAGPSEPRRPATDELWPLRRQAGHRDLTVLVIGALAAINLLQYKWLESNWSRDFGLYNSILLIFLTIFLAAGMLNLLPGVPRLFSTRPRKLSLFILGVVVSSASIAGLLVMRQGSVPGLSLGLVALLGLSLVIVAQFEVGQKDAAGIFLAVFGMALVTLVPVHEAFGVAASGDLWAAPNLAMMAIGAALACAGIVVVHGLGEPGGRPLASYGLWLVGVMALFLVPFHEAAGINSNNVYGTLDQTLMVTGALAIVAGVALFLRKLWREREFGRLLEAGDVKYRAGEYGKALEHYEMALLLEAGNPEAMVRAGAALERQGNLEAAQESLEGALELAPDDHLALSTLSAVFRRAGNPGKALALATAATGAAPRSGVAWLNRANALADLKRNEEALEDFDRALELDPGYGKAWYNKGVLLLGEGRSAEALECFEEVLGLAPDDERARGMRERCISVMGVIRAEG